MLMLTQVDGDSLWLPPVDTQETEGAAALETAQITKERESEKASGLRK